MWGLGGAGSRLSRRYLSTVGRSSAPKSSSSRSTVLNKCAAVSGAGTLALMGSPIMVVDEKAPLPTSEKIAFASGNAWGYITERILENEAGQNLMLLLFILSSAYGILHQGMIYATVRRLQCQVAPNFGAIGMPRYTAKSIPPNPLLRNTKAPTAK